MRKKTVIDIFPNDENLQVANWQNATDKLIATVKTQNRIPHGAWRL